MTWEHAWDDGSAASNSKCIKRKRQTVRRCKRCQDDEASSMMKLKSVKLAAAQAYNPYARVGVHAPIQLCIYACAIAHRPCRVCVQRHSAVATYTILDSYGIRTQAQTTVLKMVGRYAIRRSGRESVAASRGTGVLSPQHTRHRSPHLRGPTG